MIEKINYQTYEKPTDYVQWKPGINILRVVSDGYFRKFHEFKAGGQFVSSPCEGDGCKACVADRPSILKYMWIVLERTNGAKVKYIKVGPMIGDRICKLGKGEDVRTFDIQITQTKGTKTSYKVEKMTTSKPITPEEKEMITKELSRLSVKYFS